MNHQDTKTQGRQMGRWAGRQIGRSPLRSSLSAHLPALLLAFLMVSSARAQVPSHTPTYTPDAFSATTVFQPVGRPLVRVNGTALTDRDLLREMLTIFPYARAHNGFPKAMEADIRDGAMKMMIFEELVYQESKRVKATVPPAQLSKAMAQFRQQFHSPQQYQQFLQEECQGSPKVLQAKVERSLLIEKFMKQEVVDKSTVSVAEAEAYYDQHPDDFRMMESFSFQSISILPPPNATPVQLQEANKRAADVLRQAKATASYEQFGLLAEKLSDDDFHVMMGDHKAADRSKLPPTVVTALAAMQPGQVSGLIEFDTHDYTILRLNAHNAAGLQKFEAVKDALRGQMQKDKTEQLRKALATRLSKNAKIEKA